MSNRLMKPERPVKLTRPEWANLINGTLRTKTELAFELGSYLIDARKELGRGEYGAMVREDLLIDTSTARKLRAIASNETLLANRSRGNTLPVSWTILYALTLLKPDMLQALIDDGTVHCRMTREQAEALKSNRIVYVRADQEKGDNKPGRLIPCAFCAEENGNVSGGKGGHVTVAAGQIADETRVLAERLVNEISDVLTVYPVHKYPKGSRRRRSLDPFKLGRSKIKQKIDSLLKLGDRVPPEVREMVADELRRLAKEATTLAEEFDLVTEAQQPVQETARVPRLKGHRETSRFQPRSKSTEVSSGPGTGTGAAGRGSQATPQIPATTFTPYLS